jgi:transposase
VTGPRGSDSKHDELRRRNALHPRPEQVSDPLFAEQEFFDPRDAVQVKYEMLRRVRVDGIPIARAAEDCGFSRPTFYQAQMAFDRAGLPGLLPAKRGPRRAHKLSSTVMEYVAKLLTDDPEVAAAELAEQLRDRFDLVVHPRSIERALARRERKGS